MPEIVEEEGEKAVIWETEKAAASSQSPTSSDEETLKGDDDTIVKSPKIARQPQIPPFRGQGGNSIAVIFFGPFSKLQNEIISVKWQP